MTYRTSTTAVSVFSSMITEKNSYPLRSSSGRFRRSSSNAIGSRWLLFLSIVLFVGLFGFSSRSVASEEATPSPTVQKAEELSGAAVAKDAALFSDNLFSSLKSGVKSPQIAKMRNPFLKTMATSMLSGNYGEKFRIATYEAYPTIGKTAHDLKTSSYNQFENPTGIYFKSGENAVLFVGNTQGEKIALRVYCFGKDHADHQYPLQTGVNVIPMKGRGLGYISYYTDNFKKAPKIKIHIASGKVNGYFDSTIHTDQDWKKMLADASSDILDIRGKFVQLAFPVATMKETCPEKGLELINLYDDIINQQQEIMGLVKYNKRPKNRMFGRVIWNGYMHADGMGAAFHNDTLREIGNPDRLKENAWGIAHEFGHVNQVRPGMKWVSTTEVTNNIFSSWTNYLLNPTNMRLEHERINGGDGNVIGGRFNAFLNAALVHGEQWLCQKGPDKMKGYEDGGDHFVKLVPLWQLQLYYTAAGKGNKDFYPDIFEIVRNTDEKKLSNGQLQLNFMKNACDVAKEDLTDFFQSVGMLKPIDKDLDDYQRAQLTITEADCKKLVDYAKRYHKPKSPVIYYISANSVNAFKKSLPVVGKTGQGVTEKGTTRTVAHSEWKNVVAFETYQGPKLIKIAMVGTGSPDNSSTLVQYPQGATRIEAVDWSGKRTLVYGDRK